MCCVFECIRTYLIESVVPDSKSWTRPAKLGHKIPKRKQHLCSLCLRWEETYVFHFFRDANCIFNWIFFLFWSSETYVCFRIRQESLDQNPDPLHGFQPVFFQGVEGVIFDGHVLHHVERAPDATLHAGLDNPHYIYSTHHVAPHVNRNVCGNSYASTYY